MKFLNSKGKVELETGHIPSQKTYTKELALPQGARIHGVRYFQWIRNKKAKGDERLVLNDF